MIEGWCMKCKAKREMKNIEHVTMKNGKPAIKGVCSKCSTKMFKIGDSTSTVKSKKGGKTSKKMKHSKKVKHSKKSKKVKHSKKSKKNKY